MGILVFNLNKNKSNKSSKKINGLKLKRKQMCIFNLYLFKFFYIYIIIVMYIVFLFFISLKMIVCIIILLCGFQCTKFLIFLCVIYKQRSSFFSKTKFQNMSIEKNNITQTNKQIKINKYQHVLQIFFKNIIANESE